MGSHKARSSFKPEAGEIFNTIVSIQYRGSRANDYKELSFSSVTGIERVIRVLRLEEDLARMGLPRLQDADCVFRSSFGKPFTIEMLFPHCEGGQPSELSFHSFYKQFSENPRPLEAMDIMSIYIYFLPRAKTKLDRSCYAPYVLNRPKGGWKAWYPERHPERNAFYRSSDMHLAPRERRRDRAPTPSRSRPGSPYAASVNGEGPSSRPLARNTSSPGPSRSQPNHHGPLKPKMRSPSPAALPPAGHLPSAVPIALSDPSSISSAIQSLSKLVEQDYTAVKDAPPPSPPARTVDPPVKKESDADTPDTDIATLRSQLEQSSAQRDQQRKRIRELQQELSTERAARVEAEALLEEQRHLLRAERRKLEDMRQECSAPFLVPVLLDAFLKADSMARDA